MLRPDRFANRPADLVVDTRCPPCAGLSSSSSATSNYITPDGPCQIQAATQYSSDLNFTLLSSELTIRLWHYTRDANPAYFWVDICILYHDELRTLISGYRCGSFQEARILTIRDLNEASVGGGTMLVVHNCSSPNWVPVGIQLDRTTASGIFESGDTLYYYITNFTAKAGTGLMTNWFAPSGQRIYLPRN